MNASTTRLLLVSPGVFLLRASAHQRCLFFAQALISAVSSSRKRSSALSLLRASAHQRCLVFAQALISAVSSSRKRSSALSLLRASAHQRCLFFAQALISAVSSSRKRSSALSLLRASAHQRCLVFAQALISAVSSSRKRSSALSLLRASAHQRCLFFAQALISAVSSSRKRSSALSLLRASAHQRCGTLGTRAPHTLAFALVGRDQTYRRSGGCSAPRIGGRSKAMSDDEDRATLADVGEFGVIDRLVAGRRQGRGVVLGPGDDAAVLAAPDGRVVVTTDMLVEGRHFRLDWANPHDVGRKAIAQNAADIEAMGASVTGFVVAVGAPSDTPARRIDALA